MRLSVRGRTWRLEAATPGEHCNLLRLVELGAEAPRKISLLTPFDRPRPLESVHSVRVVGRRRWLHDFDRRVLGIHAFGVLKEAACTSVRILPYQLEPALAILGGLASRVLIADGVGLGKTIQAGLILRELALEREAFRALVLVPAGLRDQWANELMRHFALVSTQANAEWLRGVQNQLPPDVNPWSLPGLYIASHDFVKRPESLKPLETVHWTIVVVDEAHAASLATDRRAALDAIASRADRVVLLTATPHWEDPAEFRALCQIGRLDPAEGRIALFARSRSAVGGVTARRTVVLPVAPSDPERRMHRLLERYSAELWREATARSDDRARLVSVVLRKRALSSAASLKTSIERRLALLAGQKTDGPEQLPLPLLDEDPLPDDEPGGELGVKGLADVTRERRWLRAIAEAAGAPARLETKTTCLLRLLGRLREPVIVFTEYRDTLDRLRQRVAATGRAVAVLHGGVSPQERSRVPATLAHGAPVLLATDAASEGLNLHEHCRLVVHYELPWHPMRLEQRAGRVDRLGQSRRVHEIALVAADTAERLVIAPLTLKASRTGAQLRSSFGAALSESRIAEAVMGAALTTPPRERTDCAEETVEVATHAQAYEEAARIERHRVLIARSGHQDRQTRALRPPVTTIRSRPGSDPARAGCRLIVVCSIVVEDSAGCALHSELLPLQLPLEPDIASRLTPTRLRHLCSTYARSDVLTCIPPVQVALRDALDSQDSMQRKIQAAIDGRRQLIAARHESTAQALLQRQLFRSRREGAVRTLSVPGEQDRAALQAHARLVAAIACVNR